MATVDELVSDLQSTADDYGSALGDAYGSFISMSGGGYNLNGPVTDLSNVRWVDGEPVDSYHATINQSPVDAAAAARNVEDFTKPFVDMLEETPDDVSELTTDLKDQMERITNDLGLITLSPDDFTPQLILETYRTDADRFLQTASDWFEQYLEAYSPVTQANVAKSNEVLDEMLDGLGLPPIILENIWNQTRDQAVAEAQSLESQAFSEFAARGYAKPPGALAAQLQNIRYQRYNKTAAASRDIAIKQAEIIIDLKKFGVQTALSTYNDYVNALIGFIRSYIGQALALMKDLYSEPLRQKVDYVLGMNRLLFQGDETYLNSLKLIPEVASRGGDLAALPYEVQAKLQQLNTQLAGIEAEFSRIDSDIHKANLQASVQLKGMEADYHTRLDGTAISGLYQFKSSSVGAASSALGGFSRISATALSGLNAIASDTKISF